MNTTIIPQETSVALISGGKSGEREISLVSGSAVYDALIDAGFSVTQIDPAKKEDLVTLVSEDFDVAFLALHGKLGEDGISVDSCPDPVAFGNQRFFKLFILLLRQFDAVLDLVKIKGVLSGIITAQRIHFGAVRRHD